jgi:hypothetical protein
LTFIESRKLENGLSRPLFIATEGMSDARLLDKLLLNKGFTDCGVGCPSDEGCKGTGKAAFPMYFPVIQLARGRATSVPFAGLLVVADADDNAAKTFADVQAALRYSGFPVPADPFVIDRSNAVKVGVFLMPGIGRNGTLEHLLLDAAFEKNPKLAQCLDEFSACTGVLRSAKPNQLAKMRMSALSAAFCEDNPWASGNGMLTDRNCPVPIDSRHFHPLLAFIEEFRR